MGERIIKLRDEVYEREYLRVERRVRVANVMARRDFRHIVSTWNVSPNAMCKLKPARTHVRAGH